MTPSSQRVESPVNPGRFREALARKAISLDPDLEYAHFVLGEVLVRSGRLREARIAFLRAIELNPSVRGPLVDIAVTSASLGFYDEALYWAERGFAVSAKNVPTPYSHVAQHLLRVASGQQTEEFLTRATERFPDNHRIQILWMYLDGSRGRDGSAAQRARQLLERFPNNFEALFAAAEGLYLLRAEDAASVLERLYRDAPDARLAGTGRTMRTAYAHTLLTAGLWERAESLFHESVAFNRQELADGDERWGVPYELAAIAAVRGSTDEALDWLQRAYEAGLRGFVVVEADPMLDALRDEPRFVALIARMQRDVAAMRARAFSPDGTSMFRDSLSAQ